MLASGLPDTFPIVRRKDIDKHGEYRTKRVILEIYDEMAEAMRTGIPYQTRLDPPPANGWIPPEEAFRDLETPATPTDHAGAPKEPAELVLVSPDPDLRQHRLDFNAAAEETFVLVNGHRARLLRMEPQGAVTKYLVHVEGEPEARTFLVSPAVVEMVEG